MALTALIGLYSDFGGPFYAMVPLNLVIFWMYRHCREHHFRRAEEISMEDAIRLDEELEDEVGRFLKGAYYLDPGIKVAQRRLSYGPANFPGAELLHTLPGYVHRSQSSAPLSVGDSFSQAGEPVSFQVTKSLATSLTCLELGE